jgi:hypothetical protein
MNYNNPSKAPPSLSPKVLLILGVILTIAIIIGIKLLVMEDAGDSAPQPYGQDSVFKEEKAGGVLPGSVPAARSEMTSGDSLEIFEKANVGYSSDGASSTAAAKQAQPETAKIPPAPAPGKKKAAASKKLKQRTTIPRLQGAKPFGTDAPDKTGTQKSGAGMPDMSGMLKQAQQNQGSGN